MSLSSYVDPYIGSIGHLLTATPPICAYPHAMSSMRPCFTPGTKDFYLADSIVGFSAGCMTVMPESDDGSFSSRFDHDLEKINVNSYSVWLEGSQCNVLYSVTQHGGCIRFSFDQPGNHRIRISAEDSVILEGNRLTVAGKSDGVRAYSVGTMNGITGQTETCGESKSWHGITKWKGLILETSDNTVELSFAFSYISVESAQMSFDSENTGVSLEDMIQNCGNAWDILLGKFHVDGPERTKKIFYTALYRVFLRQNCISENGKYYSGFDKKVHDDNGHKFYVNDGVWDTHRGAHPLQALIEPEIHQDILESFIRQYDQSGWLQDFPHVVGGIPCMLGSHTTTLFANALAHHIDFDVKRAWKAIRYAHFEGSLLPWYIGPETEFDRYYREKGYCPALHPDEPETIPEVHKFERRQAVAVTLEQAYDDYAAAKIAASVGALDDEKTLLKRAQNYRNLFDSDIKFMAPKDKDGKFIRPYDPKLAYAQGGRDYFAECNAWVYTMEVRHDVKGLMDLFGGKAEFAKRMDRIFAEQPDMPVYHWLSKFPDSTGLIGQFCMGNEPAFHIPYMYNFCGQPWKTQKILHDICRVWFSPHPLGICGDEDGGAMSAWYAFTALGFYPFCPGSGVYVIGSPQFDRSEIKLGNGNTFTVEANGASEGKKYIASAELNDVKISRSWFTADELLAGGILKLEMSDKPCKSWATEDRDCPPSLY